MVFWMRICECVSFSGHFWDLEILLDPKIPSLCSKNSHTLTRTQNFTLVFEQSRNNLIDRLPIVENKILLGFKIHLFSWFNVDSSALISFHKIPALCLTSFEAHQFYILPDRNQLRIWSILRNSGSLKESHWKRGYRSLASQVLNCKDCLYAKLESNH